MHGEYGDLLANSRRAPLSASLTATAQWFDYLLDQANFTISSCLEGTQVSGLDPELGEFAGNICRHQGVCVKDSRA